MRGLIKSKIIPTIFSLNKKEFDEKFKKIVPIASSIQIDFMDGFFVKKKSVHPRHIPNLSGFSNSFEAHLMVKDPVSYFDKIKDLGFKKVIVHIESFSCLCEIEDFFSFLKKQKIVPVLALNPSTRLDDLIIEKFNFFLLMGVLPGAEGQKLRKSVFNKISILRGKKSGAKIQIDGGVNEKNASKLFKAGVDYLNSGSFISENDDPKGALRALLK